MKSLPQCITDCFDSLILTFESLVSLLSDRVIISAEEEVDDVESDDEDEGEDEVNSKQTNR